MSGLRFPDFEALQRQALAEVEKRSAPYMAPAPTACEESQPTSLNPGAPQSVGGESKEAVMELPSLFEGLALQAVTSVLSDVLLKFAKSLPLTWRKS